MASSAPVCSPTEIIWITMGGNTPEALRGSASVLPAVTAARHWSTAFSTTLFPAVRAVMRRPSRMGTPEETRVPRVRVKRATATRSEEHTSELQSRQYLVCRLLLEKKKKPDETQPT